MLDISIEETRIYKEIREEARTAGLEVGLAEGRAEGRAEVLLALLSQRFGQVPEEQTQKIYQLTAEQNETLCQQLFDIDSLQTLEQKLLDITQDA